ncbi:aminotransferase class V-fold PLP-dependent enzyme [Clostridium botulinum]|uniref:Class V aminotransferase n=3 Tax=Clostridium botulinum TaxID=1491 RepID=A0A0A0IBC5_CLOBO|nr:aminotransferase class V-fold PLP-dependent enzyme [Clostridium botulinum]KEI01138.1 class V aminotransferase [Clostridium botulinum C/D str. BKT75002]KEI13383.1 class V aminotransferase [Clostridium botulinum C/D str. BKT2873]KGM93214.1 class V aminotransferase [Clostridium botulinum D str. CCUG 7971]KGM98734.1 class V aminotransferase [Clostridium botulinum C/D str. DC5]KOC50796.1 class V aminotransferase [Clostridium botulinum]
MIKLDTSFYRKLVVAVNTKVPLINGEYGQAINFDNAATTPPFTTVVDEVIKFMYLYSSVHRGFGYKSQFSTKVYENSRNVVAKFVNCDTKYNSIIFVKNTTEAINKLSNMLYSKLKDYVILSTDMEHHSNDLPWRKYNIDYIGLDKNFRLSLDDLKTKLQNYNGKVKLVTVTGASNVTGFKNSIHEIAKLAHMYGAKILVDGAQLVPHSAVDMKPMDSDEHIDYLAFSAHKLYAPFGTGVLIAPKSDLNDIPPDYSGGGTVDIVTHDTIKWLDTPSKDEAGSPNVIGVVALSASLKTLSILGMKNIEMYENYLAKYTIDALKTIPDIKLYCDNNPTYNHISTIPFNIKGITHETVAKILSYESGISVRDGCFCAQPYVQKLLKLTPEQIDERVKTGSHKPGMVRISLGLYNTTKEIDVLISTLKKIVSSKDAYIKKYSSLPNDLYFPM